MFCKIDAIIRTDLRLKKYIIVTKINALQGG